MPEAPLRFVISVDQDWQVTVSCPRLAETRPARAMRKLADGPMVFYPLPPLAELSGLPVPRCCELYCRTADPAVLATGWRQITGRKPDLRTGTSPFGGYLFHCLIGTQAWQWIRDIAGRQGSGCIELALSWADGDVNLNRLNWEMMHDGKNFLVSGLAGITVAITRLVAGTRGDRWQPPQTEFPPRVLFVVGTTLNDPSLRPAAEFLGLLRELRESGRRIRSRLIEKASPRELSRVISVFQPDVVHFICHGDWDHVSQRGFLELAPDEGSSERRRYADQLYAAMTVDGCRPPLVILSACRTGSAEARRPDPADVLEGAHDLAPLATELVRHGVPLVLGMAGRISDDACRLFTRQFGDALVRGDSLVVATAEARRAVVSLGNSANASVDWAFPALFAAEQVEPGWAPVKPGAADQQTPEETWIKGYDLQRDLVFCGRNNFFDAYYGFFTTPNPRRILTIETNGQPGLGRKRLLAELAAQMLRDGHIPVILASENPAWEAPRSLQSFREMLISKIRLARRILNLGSAPDSQLRLLAPGSPAAGAGATGLHEEISADLGPDGALTPAALSRAMQFDLSRLVKDARQQHELIRSSEGRAVIVLDQVEKYGQPLFGDVIFEMLGEYGFGTSDEPVPAVLAVATAKQPEASFVEDTMTQVSVRTWIRQETLEPFNFDAGEDLLAYSWILLNPPPNFRIDRHYLDYEVGVAAVEIARNFMEADFGGLPGNFARQDLFVGFTRKIGQFARRLPSDADDRRMLKIALGRDGGEA